MVASVLRLRAGVHAARHSAQQSLGDYSLQGTVQTPYPLVTVPYIVIARRIRITGHLRISGLPDIARGVEALADIDPDLQPIIAQAGEIPLRLRPPGYEGLARIVVGQQVSVASANAIWTRFAAALPNMEADSVETLDDPALQACGLSRPKIKTFRAINNAILNDGLDLINIAKSPAEEAQAALVAIKGIGPWTAEVYLMFCAGHPDIFPAGDVALQNAVRDAGSLAERPGEKDLRDIASRWKPWRSVAARIFWAYYRVTRSGRETLPV